MPTSTAERRTARAPMTAHPIAGWSKGRKVVSAAVVLVMVLAAGLFAFRASLSPLSLWTGASQCSTLPKADVGRLFGLAISRDLRGAGQITILDVETLASSGASAPRYWIVPVTDGSGGTGSATADDPPPHWSQRIPAAGATFRAHAPANLLVEMFPRDGHALLTGIRVTYRTPDGFIHAASGNPDMEVDTTSECDAHTSE